MRNKSTPAFGYLLHRLISYRVTRTWFWVAASLVYVGAVWVMLERTGLAVRIPNVADSVADWLTTKAFFDNLDPYTPVTALAEFYGVSYKSPIAPATPLHPRLPGAFLLQSPMLLADAATASRWMVGLSCLAVFVTLAVLVRRATPPLALAPGFFVVALLSGIATWAFAFVTQSPILMLLLAVSFLLLLTDRHTVSAGVLIGFAGVLKIFPLIVLVPLLYSKRYRPVVAGLVTFVALNAAAILMSDISIAAVLSALDDSLETYFSYPGNISLASWLDRLVGLDSALVWWIHMPILALSSVVLLRRQSALSAQFLGVTTLGVLLSPVSWGHYLLMILPAAVFLLLDKTPGQAAKILTIVGLLPFLWIGQSPWFLIGMIVLYTAALSSARVFLNTQPSRFDAAAWTSRQT